MAILPSMTLEQPTVGASRGQWGGILNANLAKIDGHTHVSGKGEPVPVAGLDIDADMSFGSLFGPKDLHAITFASIVALSSNTYNKSLFVSNGTGGLSANELYWRSSSGSHVKLTAGNSLNVAAFVGGIGGDYTAIGAVEAFDNADKDYTFKDGAGKWAGMRGGTLVLSPKGGTSTFRITLQPPAGLATSYVATLPAALPVAASVMQMSITGVMTVSNALPANTEIHHGTQTLALTGTNFIVQSGSAIFTTNGSISTTSSSVLIANIPLLVGDQITSVSAIFDSGTGTVDVTDFHVSRITVNGTDDQIGITTASNIAGPTPTTIDVTDTTLAANESFIVSISINATGCIVSNVNVTFNRP